MRILAVVGFALLGSLHVLAQDTTIARPQIITSGIRTTRIASDGTFEVRGVRLIVPKHPVDASIPVVIRDVTLRLASNSIRSPLYASGVLRVEIDKTIYMSETDTYTIKCYVANAVKPVDAGTMSGACTFELTAVATSNGMRSALASKTFAVTFTN